MVTSSFANTPGKSACIAGAMMLLLAGPGLSQSYTCLSAGDDDADSLREYIVALVTATDPRLVQSREDYVLPATSANQVSVDSRKRTCDLAGAAYHSVFFESEPPFDRILVVVRVGNDRYVVLDHEQLAGHYAIAVVFDGNWQYLAAFTN